MPMFFRIVLAPLARDVCPTLGLMFECSCSCPSVLVLVPVFEYSSVGDCSSARVFECSSCSSVGAQVLSCSRALVLPCSCSSARVLECTIARGARVPMFECSCSCSCPTVFVLVPMSEYSSVGECSSPRVLERSSCSSVGAQVLVVLVLEWSVSRVHDCS